MDLVDGGILRSQRINRMANGLNSQRASNSGRLMRNGVSANNSGVNSLISPSNASSSQFKGQKSLFSTRNNMHTRGFSQRSDIIGG
jgi:hypothetical protein